MSVSAYRVGVASIMQETNTFSPLTCDLGAFESQGLVTGQAILARYRDTLTELGGAIRRLEASGAVAVPLLRAWALSSGRVSAGAFAALRETLVQQLEAAGYLDGLVLSLHGAMAAEGLDGADAALLAAARQTTGGSIPIVVCVDLHANITTALAEGCDALLGYHNYPHTDMAQTGERAADLLLRTLRKEIRPVTSLAKRAMLVPAEVMQTASGPMGNLRRAADAATHGAVLDISLFPVQPWLDVDDLGFGVTVTTDGDPEAGRRLADHLASKAWESRHDFEVELVAPRAGVDRARASTARPFLMSESADSPSAGAAGDSPAMVDALLTYGADLDSIVTLVDASAVAACLKAGRGAAVDVSVGASIDSRFHRPVRLRGLVDATGNGTIRLTGPSYTGTDFSMGAYAVVRAGRLSVLLTEQPALTVDPGVFRHAGLDPDQADVLVVRSATQYKAAYSPASVAEAVTLDLPGASTPRLEQLDFRRAPRPLYPIDDG